MSETKKRQREEPEVTPKIPIIIACTALKGGVGKTTVSVHLAYTLAKDFGHNVVLYDCDSQRSASVVTLSKRIEADYKGCYQNMIDAHGVCTLKQQLDAVNKSPLFFVKAANALDLWKAGPGEHGSLRIVPGLASHVLHNKQTQPHIQHITHT